MDIFTTQLTSVVPVPIKPTSLKVKALLKEAATGKLKEDLDHLENHEYYFTTEEDQYHGSEKEAEQSAEADSDEATTAEEESTDETLTDAVLKKKKHLDIYA